MENSKAEMAISQAEAADRESKPLYQRPAIRVLEEKDVLAAFQVTVAAASWWVM
jgi:hypothetical protein